MEKAIVIFLWFAKLELPTILSVLCLKVGWLHISQCFELYFFSGLTNGRSVTEFSCSLAGDRNLSGWKN